jgi:hypothetical protein
MAHRSLATIAAEICRDWKQPYFGAVPYLNALSTMDQVSDGYYNDSGVSVVLYFLSNATSWRGPVAKRVKAELKQIAGQKLTKAEREALAETPEDRLNANMRALAESFVRR